MKLDKSNPVFTFGLLVLNISCSIGIVLINKSIYSSYGFPNVTLTFLHFVFTFFGLLVCWVLGLFTARRIPVLQVVPLSLSFCGFVVFTNLSLQNNTVGTYQVIKCMTTPVIIIIQKYLYGKTVSNRVKLTLVSMQLQTIYFQCL